METLKFDWDFLNELLGIDDPIEIYNLLNTVIETYPATPEQFISHLSATIGNATFPNDLPIVYTKQWIKDKKKLIKSTKPVLNGKQAEPKITDKIRGIALLIAYENDKLPKHIKQLWDRPGVKNRKVEIMKYAEKIFGLDNGKNVYDWTGYKLEKLKKDCTSEYEAALNLYKQIF